MKSESEILYEIRRDLGREPSLRLFRNNCGAFRDQTGRCVQYGLAPGSPDLVGLQTLTITQDLVGRAVALFVGLECKSAHGRTSEEQQSFLAMLAERGAVSGVVRSTEDVRRILRLPI